MRNKRDQKPSYKKLLFVSGFILLGILLTLLLSQNLLKRQLSGVKFDITVADSLNDNGLWGPKLNHERLLLRLERELLNASDDEETRIGAGFMEERWLDLGPALFYKTDDVLLRADHHALFLLYAAEAGDTALFSEIEAQIAANFLRSDGLLERASTVVANPSEANQKSEERPYLDEITEEVLASDPTVYFSAGTEAYIDDSATLTYMRALALAHQKWGEAGALEQLRTTSAAYLSRSKDGLPPLADWVIEVWPTPPVFVGEEGGVTPTPTPANQGESVKQLGLIRLRDIDLYTLYVLRDLDPAYETIYEEALAIVSGGLRDGLAVYAEAYEPTSDSYILYTDNAVVSLEDQISIMMHLAEVDALPPQSLAWLKSRLNNYRLVETYTLQDVNTIEGNTLPIRYAQLARLARIEGDIDLYAKALDRLLDRNLSTVTLSPIYGMVFRDPTENDDVRITFGDNVWALLGTY